MRKSAVIAVCLLAVSLFAADAVITVDLTQKRIIGGHERLDRHTFFGVYHEVGYGEWRIIDGKNIDEWIYEEGDMLPSRGTTRYDKYWQAGGYVDYTEDPDRPGEGFITPDELLENGPPASRYQYAEAHHPDHKTILSGSGHGQWPDFMCWPNSQTNGVNTVKHYAAHGEAVSLAFESLTMKDALMPVWYEVTNESDIQKNWGWHWGTGAWDKLSEMHNAVADAMHAAFPDVKIAGATDAWPYRDGSDGSFNDWNNANKRFIELSGGKLDCYSFHPYENDYYEDHQSNTQYEAQFEGNSAVWTTGRLEAFVDLWENEHILQWGSSKPFVISEYGLLGLENGDGWTDPYQSGRKYFSYIRTCNGVLMALLDRPDIIDKLSAFIMSQAPYDLANGLVFARSDDSGSSYYKSRFFDWLRFWKDLNGEWLHTTSDNYHLLVRAFIENDETLRIVLHNTYKDPQTVSLNLKQLTAASAESQEMKLLSLEDEEFFYDDYAAVDDLSQLVLPAEATAMIKIKLDAGSREAGYETNYYADKVLENIQQGQPHQFTVEIDNDKSYITQGVLHLSLYHVQGFDTNPEFIRVNGNSVSIPDITHSDGITRCWKQFEIRVPEDMLQKGSNTVTVQFPKSGGKITSVRLAVVQSDIEHLAVDDAQVQQVRQFTLEQNYPNPFNPSTKIEYRLDQSGMIRLVVYDANGRAINNLIDGNQHAGTHQIFWDGKDDSGNPAASGIYFYRLTSGQQTMIRKMILLH